MTLECGKRVKKIVMKFGGTSVATGENIRRVANIVADSVKKDRRVVVVVSALSGVTNQLVEEAKQAKKKDEKQIQEFTKNLVDKHTAVAAKAIEDTRIRKEVTQVIKKTVDELENSYTKPILPNESQDDESIQILKRRLASGEITKEEFEDLKSALE